MHHVTQQVGLTTNSHRKIVDKYNNTNSISFDELQVLPSYFV